MLAMDVAVCVADVDFPELGQKVNTGTIGGPQFGMALFAIMDIAGQQILKKSAVTGRHVLPHFLQIHRQGIRRMMDAQSRIYS